MVSYQKNGKGLNRKTSTFACGDAVHAWRKGIACFFALEARGLPSSRREGTSGGGAVEEPANCKI